MLSLLRECTARFLMKFLCCAIGIGLRTYTIPKNLYADYSLFVGSKKVYVVTRYFKRGFEKKSERQHKIVNVTYVGCFGG